MIEKDTLLVEMGNRLAQQRKQMNLTQENFSKLSRQSENTKI